MGDMTEAGQYTMYEKANTYLKKYRDEYYDGGALFQDIDAVIHAIVGDSDGYTHAQIRAILGVHRVSGIEKELTIDGIAEEKHRSKLNRRVYGWLNKNSDREWYSVNNAILALSIVCESDVQTMLDCLDTSDIAFIEKHHIVQPEPQSETAIKLNRAWIDRYLSIVCCGWLDGDPMPFTSIEEVVSKLAGRFDVTSLQILDVLDDVTLDEIEEKLVQK